jgi:hypothetical protein
MEARIMTIKMPGAVALIFTMLAGEVAAASPTADGPLPNAAYFAADLHYCASATVALASTRPVPSGEAAIVHQEVLIGAYGGDCEDFHAEEVLPRLYLSPEGS